jgi:membrane-bound serine protease (ClpP class)
VKRLLALWLLLVTQVGGAAPEAFTLTVADSINPGTADYVVSAIDRAEAAGAPYLVISLDTPGGLLSSTRVIVQRMLATKVPIVVYVAPRGARAGSAGALITFASDVAAMAPGTTLGAAHPVTGSGEKMDRVMLDKVTNDTAAFAESLARARGRNATWAVKAVRKSEVLIAEEAQKQGVIDLIAENIDDLQKQLAGYKLHQAKGGTTTLPAEKPALREEAMSVRQRTVSFLADPNLAYLILTAGGVCLWIELTHPGLILPGVLGAVCLIVSLVSFQTMPIRYGALALILVGMALLIAELFLPTFGMVGLLGVACFLFGSLYLMDTSASEYQLSLKLILPTAAVLAVFALALGLLVLKSRKARRLSGVDGLVGELGEVRDAIGDAPGRVFVHGELWTAVAEGAETIPVGAVVVVKAVENLRLIVAPRPA